MATFDDIFDKARVAMNVAAKKTEDVVEISKMKFEVARLHSHIKELYEQLGHGVYRAKKEGLDENEFTVRICGEIDEALVQLAEMDNAIADRKNLVICPSCQFKNDKENFFCSRCGEKLHFEDQCYYEACDESEAGNGCSCEDCECGEDCDCTDNTESECSCAKETEEKTEK